MIWTSLTLADRGQVGYPGNDDADLVNVLSAIDDIDLAVLFIEQKNSMVKISWRSKPGFDVSKVAVKFGGGGHPAASGAEVSGDLDQVQTLVLQASRDIIFENNRSHTNGTV
jgi:phosphoesterase RecJ-like protein